MSGKSRLVLGPWIKGESINYICSICHQPFLLKEDCSPREAMEELLEAFNEHFCEIHAEAQEPRRET